MSTPSRAAPLTAPPWRRSSRAAGLAVFLASFSIQLTFWLALPASMRIPESTDYVGVYRVTAHNLMDGRGLVSRTGEPATHFPPGYPLLLRGVFGAARAFGVEESAAVRLFEMLCAATAALLVHRIALRLWRPLPAALVALAWITYLPAIWTTHQLGSEPAYMVAWLASLLLVLAGLRDRPARIPLLFAAGLALGCASLVRAQALGVGVVLFVLLLWGARGLTFRSRAALGAALLLGNLAVVLPWEVWAWNRLHRIIPISTSGPATVLHGLVFAVNDPDPEGGAPPPAIVELMEALRARKQEFLAPGGTLEVLREELGSRPVVAAELYAWKAARSWYGTDGRGHERPLLLLQGIYVALFAAAGVLACRGGGARRRVALSIALLIGYYWGMTTLVLSIARYMLPAMPLGCLLLPQLLPRRWRSRP